MRVVLVLLLLASCDIPEDTPESGDASAQLACRDFYDIAREADLVTDAELRERLQDLWDTAEVSETPGIAESARDMLQTATAGDVDAFASAAEAMTAACSDVEPL